MSRRWIAALCGAALVALCALTLATKPAAAQDEPSPDREPVPRCVRGFSKDACKGELQLTDQSQVYFVSCPDSTGLPGCLTLIGLNTFFTADLRDGTGSCSGPAEAPCDEFQRLARFTSNFNLTLNSTFNDPCRRRGAWDGKFRFFDNLSIAPVIEASGAGVLGVGSHRKGCSSSQANAPCALEDCENCLDTEYIPNATDPSTGLWRIGLEGLLTGKIRQGPQTGGLVTLVIQGDLFAKGTPAGITDPTDGFTFCGTIDGVSVTFCD